MSTASRRRRSAIDALVSDYPEVIYGYDNHRMRELWKYDVEQVRLARAIATLRRSIDRIVQRVNGLLARNTGRTP